MMTSILARVLFRHDTSSATMTAPCTDWPVLLMLSYSPKNTAFSSMPVRKKEWEKNASNWALLPPYILYLCHEGAASINTAPGVKKMIPCPLHIELMSTHPYVETYINENLHTHIHIKVFFFFFLPTSTFSSKHRTNVHTLHLLSIPHTWMMSIRLNADTLQYTEAMPTCSYFLSNVQDWCPHTYMCTLSHESNIHTSTCFFSYAHSTDIHMPISTGT